MGQLLLDGLDLGSELTLRDEAHAEDQRGPLPALFELLEGAALIPLAGGHMPLPKTTLHKGAHRDLQAVVRVAAGEPFDEGGFQRLGGDDGLSAAAQGTVPRSVAAQVVAALLASPGRPMAAHRGAARAAQYSAQWKG